MELRKLGSKGPEITTIGFGCWSMGGGGWDYSWGPQDDDVSITSVHVALDHGINWYDTAAVYGLGHSEEVLGKALGNRRKDVIVATKCGLVWDEKRDISRSGSYDSVIRECENSLKRLGTDYIDLYQMHWPDTGANAPVSETIRAFEDLKKQGKIRYSGVSNYDVPLLQEALDAGGIDSLQPPYSLFAREVEEEILPFCLDNGIGVVAYSPLASGLLGGRYTPETTFDPGDWRSRDPRFSGEGLRENVEKVKKLSAIADGLGLTVAQLAVAWVLANPAVTSAIIGARKPEHITSVLAAAGVTLNAETLNAIYAATA